MTIIDGSRAHKDVFMAYFWFCPATFAKSFSRPVGPSKPSCGACSRRWRLPRCVWPRWDLSNGNHGVHVASITTSTSIRTNSGQREQIHYCFSSTGEITCVGQDRERFFIKVDKMNSFFPQDSQISDTIWPIVHLLFVFWEKIPWVKPQPIAYSKFMHMFGDLPPYLLLFSLHKSAPKGCPRLENRKNMTKKHHWWFNGAVFHDCGGPLKIL